MANGYLETTQPSVSVDILNRRVGELPQAMTTLKTGETVLDLGSGDGAYSFLAAAAVGERGCVIGVETAPDMIAQARASAKQHEFCNVSSTSTFNACRLTPAAKPTWRHVRWVT